jgi:hypothetical protein
MKSNIMGRKNIPEALMVIFFLLFLTKYCRRNITCLVFYLFTDGKEIKILAVDPNTYRFLVKKCAEDALSSEQKVKIELNNSAVKNESDADEDRKDGVKDVVLEGLEKAEVKELEEGEDGDEKGKNKAGAVNADPDKTVSPADVGKAKIKQSTPKGDRESEYIIFFF